MSSTRIEELRAQLTAATDAVSLDPPEPTHTASGVERGRALYDRRSPDSETSALGRSRRLRRSTERGIAWAKDVEQNKAISAKIRRTKERKALRASSSAHGSSDELDEAASQAATQEGAEPGGESQYETVAFIPRETLLTKIATKFNFDCTGLTTEELCDLLDAPGLSDDQTAPMETADEHIETVVLPPTRVSPGGGFHLNQRASNDLGPNKPNQLPTPKPFNQPSTRTVSNSAENTDTEPEDDDDIPAPKPSTTSSPKRALSGTKSQPPLKRSRIESPENTDTEPEIELEEVPLPYQIPRSRASTGTVIPDSHPGSPNPSAIPLPGGSAAKRPQTYAGARSFFQSDSNPQQSQALPSSQQSRGAVSTTSSVSLGAPLPKSDRQVPRPPGALSRTSSSSLDGPIPPFSAQPRKPPLHSTESQSQPRRGSQARHEPLAPAQEKISTRLPGAAPRSGATAPAGRASGGGQPQASSSAVPPNAAACKPVSSSHADKVADTCERLNTLISVVIGRKDPLAEDRATSNRNGRVAPPQHQPSRAPATNGAQPSGRGEVMAEDEEGRQIAAAHAKGKRMRRRKNNKPLTSDLEGRARQVVIVAKLLLFAYVVVFGPYLNRETYLAWAPLIYELAWYREYPEVPFELPPKGTYEIMVDNLSSLKGYVKLALRGIVKDAFKLRRLTLTPDDVKHNLASLGQAYPKHYHCINPEAREGHYEGKIIGDSISAAFFSGPHAIGILFNELFDPIPVVTICYILTNLQFCLEEWSSGHFNDSTNAKQHR